MIEAKRRDHKYKLKRLAEYFNNVKKFSFPSISIDTWNGLEANDVWARNMLDFI